jgi:hypothetical protein
MKAVPAQLCFINLRRKPAAGCLLHSLFFNKVVLTEFASYVNPVSLQLKAYKKNEDGGGGGGEVRRVWAESWRRLPPLRLRAHRLGRLRPARERRRPPPFAHW